MISRLAEVRAVLFRHADADHARGLQRYFKTGPGEYGEGDVFLGIRSPVLHRMARTFGDLSLDDIGQLLASRENEARVLALRLMDLRYDRGDAALRERIFRMYLQNTRFINNWDLVDLSAPGIVGRHLEGRSRRPLYRLARSPMLWERRIAMLSCLWFIRRDDFADALGIAEILVADSHDLMHKAVGWMLREIGKRDLASELPFLEKHAAVMPRTMLRYAIEKFDSSMRADFMARKKGGKGAIGS